MAESSAVPTRHTPEFKSKARTTRPHDINPKIGLSVKFNIGAKTIFAKHVRHPGSKIPGTNYLHGPFDAAKPEIVAKIEAAVKELLE